LSIRREQTLKLPGDVAELEEANLPPDLATAIAGKEQRVELLWQRARDVRRAEPWDTDVLIDPLGQAWSVYHPLRVFFTDQYGKIWWLPRQWVGGDFNCLHRCAPQPDSECRVTRPHILVESLHLPSSWDLLEINIPEEIAIAAAGRPATIRVGLSPGSPVRVEWDARSGVQYVIPHAWRRRRIQLPDRDKLMVQGVPDEVVSNYAKRVVSVNYHPGSLCCMREHYRFRDGAGRRWLAKISDCFLIGYGDVEEHPA
jgi:hypothetical protein